MHRLPRASEPVAGGGTAPTASRVGAVRTRRLTTLRFWPTLKGRKWENPTRRAKRRGSRGKETPGHEQGNHRASGRKGTTDDSLQGAERVGRRARRGILHRAQGRHSAARAGREPV